MAKPRKTVPFDRDLYDEIFVRSFFHKGLKRRIYAWEHGLKAFRILVRKK